VESASVIVEQRTGISFKDFNFLILGPQQIACSLQLRHWTGVDTGASLLRNTPGSVKKQKMLPGGIALSYNEMRQEVDPTDPWPAGIAHCRRPTRVSEKVET
jgi:hypothetical protein